MPIALADVVLNPFWVWLVHGEASAAEGLRDALRAGGTRAEVAQPGMVLDLKAAA